MTPFLNIPLKTAVWTSGQTAHSISKQMDRPDSWLSKIIHGGVKKIKKSDRSRLAKILGVKELVIFPDFNGEDTT